jgi:hypothetical protein
MSVTAASSCTSFVACFDRISRPPTGYRSGMATKKQVQAAKRNVKKAQEGARKKRTIAHLPKSTRRELGKQGARARQRGGKPGQGLEDRNRQQLYELAKRRNIPGRSKMGKWDLIKALRRAG